MRFKIFILLVFVTNNFCQTLQDSTNLQDSMNLSNLTNQNPQATKQNYNYEPTSKSKYLAISSGVIFLGTLAGVGILYAMPESATNWDKNDISNLGTNYSRRVGSGPVVDRDDWFLNWITHPYWGAVYYMQPRVAGYSWNASVLYSFFCSSIFWEYGVEGFAEVPSWQDLVITPGIGSILGEGFYRASKHIHFNENRLLGSKILGKSALLLMDPLGIILQDLGLAKSFGVENKYDTNYTTKPLLQSMLMPTSINGNIGAQFILWIKF